MTFIFGKRSLDRLTLVHPDLQEVVKAAIKVTTIDFTVLEGIRTLDRQKELVASGASRTMNSRHLHGLAVDLGALVGGRITWQPAVYSQIAAAMLGEAAKLQIPIVWGGSWISFADLVHFELNRKFYPDDCLTEKGDTHV